MLDPRPYVEASADAYTDPLLEDIGSVHYIVRIIQSRHVFAFEGTCNAETAITDIEALPFPVVSLGVVHLGFWAAVQKAWPEFYADIRDIRVPIVLTGHSLGGALALLFGAKMCMEGRPPYAIITFGAPRTVKGHGLSELFARSNVCLQMYCNGCDLVPDLPLPELGWTHPASIIHIGEPKHLGLSIEDHHIAKYQVAIENYQAGGFEV